MNILTLFFLYSNAAVFGQGGNSIGINNAPDALLYNPAIISRGFSGSLTYAYPYGFSELRNLNFGVAYRGISVAGSQFAVSDLYTEDIVLAGYHYRFLRKIDFGLGGGIHSFNIKDYDRKIIGVINGGVRIKLGPSYIGGNFMTHLKNKLSFIDGEGSKLQNKFELATSITLPEGINWSFEGEPGKNLRAGVEAAFTKGFKVRMGIFDKSRFTIGLGLSDEHWTFDFAMLEHRELGESYFFTLGAKR